MRIAEGRFWDTRIFLLGRSTMITDNENSPNIGFSGTLAKAQQVDSRDDARQ
jgi:hypothetical protein